jgi:hypothetical protein
MVRDQEVGCHVHSPDANQKCLARAAHYASLLSFAVK